MGYQGLSDNMVMIEMVAEMRRAGNAGKSLLLSFVVMIMFVAVIAASDSAEAGTGPKNVYGYVKDYEAAPIPDILVTVNIKTSGGSIRGTMQDTTGPTDGSPVGFYTVTFAESVWDVGDIIEVIVSYSGDQEIVTEEIVGEGGDRVDVQFEYAIPQFGSIYGFVIAAGLVAVVAIVALKRKKA